MTVPPDRRVAGGAQAGHRGGTPAGIVGQSGDHLDDVSLGRKVFGNACSKGTDADRFRRVIDAEDQDSERQA